MRDRLCLLNIFVLLVFAVITNSGANEANFDQPYVIRVDDENKILSNIVTRFARRPFSKRLSNVYLSRSNVFPYFDSAISAKYPSFQPEYELVNLTSATDTCSSNNSPTSYKYYSGNLMQPEFAYLHDLLSPYHFIADKAIQRKASTNLWVGGQGVKATAHYDSVSNLYVQLSGI